MSVFNRSVPGHPKRWGDSGKPCRSQPTWRDCTRSVHHKSLMVFGAITSDFKMPMIFVEKRVKVDGRNYLKGVLEKEELS
ncbi:unnamed protein product [Haemonchus placei]|uniref:Ribosomal_L18e/L15P domain-containing protein n=1 Tax=Haemonchus placei TaxID=6290 RepID=A0A0N4WI71_HAEPC|nr:unnamed protein product [Haemonchus placei]